jgi:hypothetical protein
MVTGLESSGGCRSLDRETNQAERGEILFSAKELHSLFSGIRERSPLAAYVPSFLPKCWDLIPYGKDTKGTVPCLGAPLRPDIPSHIPCHRRSMFERKILGLI